jgi:hypothetical protein
MTTDQDRKFAEQLVRLGHPAVCKFFHTETYAEAIEAIAALDQQSARIILNRLTNL